MGKTEFLDALKRAMPGLPPATQAKTLAYYEQRFVDGAALGRSDDDIARELDAPSRIAMTLRASMHEASLTGMREASPTGKAAAPARRPASSGRMLVSAVGLCIFNLFMVAPAAVVFALLLSVYLSAFAFYVGGIAITASGLAGANELVLAAPLRAFGVDDAGRTRIVISETGIEVGDEKTPDTGSDNAPDNAPASAPDRASDTPRVVRGAEAVAGRGLHISTDLDESSRTTQTVFGFGMVLGGIALFLMSLVASRYTLAGLKRYLQMNLAMLRGT